MLVTLADISRVILLSLTKSNVGAYCGHIDLLKLSVKMITKTYVSRKLRIQFEFLKFFFS